ncbi:LexA family protein [Miniphocaeibacter massiliensis]|uniref:LexA family protein n=1 Tax=Miniphocaeibacter massiliensis TaxID=2041841 RepID=UPI000C1B9610|nr:XRE family transcriptional regulator [Miniphocaeibacter massiliensis]
MSNKIFPKNLKYLREKNGFEQLELAKMVGKKSASAISEWEKGIRMPRFGTLSDFAKIFNIDIDDLVSKDLTKPEVEILGKLSTMNPYKYIDDPVSAGSPERIEGQGYTQIYIPDNLMGKYANSPNVTIMRVNGDSMNKIIPNKSVIGILTNISACDLTNGDIVVFNDNYNYSVKRFYKSDNRIIFRPESTDEVFTDIVFDTEYENVEIIGKVIMYSVLL